MFTGNAMVCAYLIGMVTCLCAVSIGGFIERTSRMEQMKSRQLERAERRMAASAKHLRMLPPAPEKRHDYLRLLRNTAGV